MWSLALSQLERNRKKVPQVVFPGLILPLFQPLQTILPGNVSAGPGMAERDSAMGIALCTGNVPVGE